MPRRGDKVYLRKDGLWEARYVKEIDSCGRKKYGSVYARTCREAKEKRQAAMDNILLYQAPVAPRSLSVGRLVEEWLRVNSMKIKSSSMRRYEGFYRNHIKDSVGDMAVIGCGTAVIHGFAMQKLDEGLSTVTVNAILVFLHSCFKYGHRQYRLPMPEFVYFPKVRAEMRVLSQAEQRRLETFLLCDTDIYKFGVLLALYTGLRVGELCALKWSDIDGGNLTVRGTMQRLQKKDGGSEVVIGTPKTRSSSRTIPLPSFLEEYLNRFRPDHRMDSFILSTPQHSMVEPRVMQYRLKKYLSDVDIDGATFHTLRHSFATRCVDKYNFEIKTLSEILGHSSIEMTLNRYVHSSMELKKSNMEKLHLLS